VERRSKVIAHGRAAASAVHDDQAGALLERGERCISKRVSDIRALSGRDYRENSCDPNRLWLMVENLALDPSQRAAALVGFSRGGISAMRLSIASRFT
jgi:hypothetical protein